MKTFTAKILVFLLLSTTGHGFVTPPRPTTHAPRGTALEPLCAQPSPDNNPQKSFFKSLQHACMATLLALTVVTTTPTLQPAAAADSKAIVGCLFQKCQLSLAKCIANPNCLANVICINTCNGKQDETGCQIECGNLFENDVVGEFNKLPSVTCRAFQRRVTMEVIPFHPRKIWCRNSTRISLTVGGTLRRDKTSSLTFFPVRCTFLPPRNLENSTASSIGASRSRMANFFTRDALQRFVQDPAEPAHLLNHDNEYLHYQDDWYIVDYEPDNNKDGVEPFAFVYYRGSNDAWDGYGGAVIYTRASKLPASLEPRLREAARKVNMDYDRDFTVTDNTCPPSLDKGEALVLREKFAGKVALQTEQQLQAAATKLRGNVVNSVKAQVLFVESELGEAEKAFEKLSADSLKFEQERSKEVVNK